MCTVQLGEWAKLMHAMFATHPRSALNKPRLPQASRSPAAATPGIACCRILGISGAVRGLVNGSAEAWRTAFVVGLLVGGFLLQVRLACIMVWSLSCDSQLQNQRG